MVKDPYIAELLTILQETKSVDAFIMTLNLLVDARPDHRQVVPAVIRNAERLGLLAKHMLKQDAGREADVAELITNALERLVHPEAAAGCEECARPAPQPPATGPGKQQDKQNTPVLPPLKEGTVPPECKQPPARADIVRAISAVPHAVPGVYEVSRDKLQVDSELIVEKADAPRFYPLIGPAHLHHCHWKCTVRYRETIVLGFPFCAQTTRPRVEVVYLDRDHLHLWTPTATKKAQTTDTSARSQKLRQIVEEWQRFRAPDKPWSIPPERVHGGIEP
jgi:hypothetical protein